VALGAAAGRGGARGWAGLLAFRRWSPRSAPRPGSLDKRSRAATEAASLYEQLEAAMALQGLGRPQGVPPLRHAESEAIKKHPMGSEILELTRLYINVRFGDMLLDDAQRRDYEQRIRGVRAFRTPR